MRFVKMHGLGNDFIIINSLVEKLPEDLAAFSQKVCDRHFGIGADGVIIVRPSDIADMRMQIINSDGSEAEMCGNGIRCFAKYLYERKIVPSRKMTIETLAGIIKPEVILDDKGNVTVVEVDMGEPVLAGPAIPTTFNKEKVVMEPVEINGREFSDYRGQHGQSALCRFQRRFERRYDVHLGSFVRKIAVFSQKDQCRVC